MPDVLKLYYSPGACSMGPHIALEEAKLPYEAIPVDLKAKTIPGHNFLKINPKGSVPALDLGNGEILTEAAVILQYIAELRPQAGLMIFSGMGKFRTLEWLNFIATELHKGFGALWRGDDEGAQRKAKETLLKKFELVERRLKEHDFLAGDRFSIADIYLTVMLGWADYHKLDLSRFHALEGFKRRMRSRPSVVAVMEAEGIANAA